MKFDAPETTDTGGGNWLKEPGTYHMMVADTKEEPVSKSGTGLDAFQVTFQVLAGTVEGQEQKQCEVTFWNPKLTDKNEGLFARQKQAKFFVAAERDRRPDNGRLGQARCNDDPTSDASTGRRVDRWTHSQAGG